MSGVLAGVGCGVQGLGGWREAGSSQCPADPVFLFRLLYLYSRISPPLSPISLRGGSRRVCPLPSALGVPGYSSHKRTRAEGPKGSLHPAQRPGLPPSTSPVSGRATAPPGQDVAPLPRQAPQECAVTGQVPWPRLVQRGVPGTGVPFKPLMLCVSGSGRLLLGGPREKLRPWAWGLCSDLGEAMTPNPQPRPGLPHPPTGCWVQTKQAPALRRRQTRSTQAQGFWRRLLASVSLPVKGAPLCVSGRPGPAHHPSPPALLF